MHLRIIVTMQVVFVLSACSVQLASPHDVAIEARASALHEELIGFELAMRRRVGTPEGDPRAEANRARFEAWRASIETMEALSATADPRKVDCRVVMARAALGPESLPIGTQPAPAGSDCQTLGIVRLGERLEQLRVLYDRECRVSGRDEQDIRAPQRAAVVIATSRLQGCDAIWSPVPGAGSAGPHGLGVDAVLRSTRAVLAIQEAKRP